MRTICAIRKCQRILADYSSSCMENHTSSSFCMALAEGSHKSTLASESADNACSYRGSMHAVMIAKTARTTAHMITKTYRVHWSKRRSESIRIGKWIRGSVIINIMDESCQCNKEFLYLMAIIKAII